jgi:hypothetical protein
VYRLRLPPRSLGATGRDIKSRQGIGSRSAFTIIVIRKFFGLIDEISPNLINVTLSLGSPKFQSEKVGVVQLLPHLKKLINFCITAHV